MAHYKYLKSTGFIIYKNDCWNIVHIAGNIVPAGGGSVAAVQRDGFHLIVSDDDQFTLPIFLVGNLEVHDGHWLLKHVDLLYHHRLNVAVDTKYHSGLMECEVCNIV